MCAITLAVAAVSPPSPAAEISGACDAGLCGIIRSVLAATGTGCIVATRLLWPRIIQLRRILVIRTEGRVLEIRVSIERFTDSSQPGWVECVFVDAAGRRHLFVEKAPVVSAEDLWADSLYPREGFIACTVISVDRDADGREIVTVETEEPWGIESTTGQVRFEVFRDQLVETDPDAG
jgi:hypothetical protein